MNGLLNYYFLQRRRKRSMYSKLFNDKQDQYLYLQTFGDSILKKMKDLEEKFHPPQNIGCHKIEELMQKSRSVLDSYQILAYQIFDSCEAVALSSLGQAILKMYLQMNSMLKWTFKNLSTHIIDTSSSTPAEEPKSHKDSDFHDQFRERQISKFKLRSIMRGINDDYEKLVSEHNTGQETERQIREFQKFKNQALATSPSEARYILEDAVQSLTKKVQYIDKFIILRENYDESIHYNIDQINQSKIEAEIVNKNQSALEKMMKMCKKFIEDSEKSKMKSKIDQCTQTFLLKEKEKNRKNEERKYAASQIRDQLEKQKIKNLKLSKELEVFEEKIVTLSKIAATEKFRRSIRKQNTVQFLNKQSERNLKNQCSVNCIPLLESSAGCIEKYQNSEINLDDDIIDEDQFYQQNEIRGKEKEKENENFCPLRKTDKLLSSRFRQMRNRQSCPDQFEKNKCREQQNCKFKIEKCFSECFPPVQKQNRNILYPKVYQVQVFNENLISYQKLRDKEVSEDKVLKNIQIFQFEESRQHLEQSAKNKKIKTDLGISLNQNNQSLTRGFLPGSLRRSGKKKTSYFKSDEKNNDNVRENKTKDKKEDGQNLMNRERIRERISEVNFPDQIEQVEVFFPLSSRKDEMVLKKTCSFPEPSLKLLLEYFLTEENAKNYQLLTLSWLKTSPKISKMNFKKSKFRCSFKYSDESSKTSGLNIKQNIVESVEMRCPELLVEKIFMQLVLQKKKNRLSFKKTQLFLKYPFSSVYRSRQKGWRNSIESQSDLTYEQLSTYLKRIWNLHLNCSEKRKQVLIKNKIQICHHQSGMIRDFGIILSGIPHQNP